MNEFERGFFVGMLEGEGSLHISVRKSKKQLQLSPYIKIYNTNKELVNAIQKIMGGTVYYDGKSPGQKNVWVCQITGQKEIIGLLEPILPHLISKRRQAELLIDFCRIRQGKIRKAREDRHFEEEELKILEELKELNGKRGGKYSMDKIRCLFGVA